MMPRHDVLCIDMKSFYASCEAVALGYNPLEVKLAVVGDLKRNGSVVLASSPKLKKEHNIKTGSRLFEINRLKRKDIIVVQSRMGYYRGISKQIRKIFEEFVPPNQIHTYSVDESWLTLDGTYKINGDAWHTAIKILNRIKEVTGIYATVGIGDNKFLAKVVLDNYAKENGIAECRYEDVESLLHPLPIQKIWGFGSGMKKRFSYMRVYKFGDLMNVPKERLEKVFGINGTRYYYLVRGIDFEPVIYEEGTPPPSVFGFELEESEQKENIKSIGRGITLLRDYQEYTDIVLVLRELIDEVAFELRKKDFIGRTIHLGIHYSHLSEVENFSRRKTIEHHTNDVNVILETALVLLNTYLEKYEPVRQIHISVGSLIKEISIEKELKFDEELEVHLTEEEKRKRLEKTKDYLNNKYGKGTVLRASSLKDGSVIKSRSKKIGGHFE